MVEKIPAGRINIGISERTARRSRKAWHEAVVRTARNLPAR